MKKIKILTVLFLSCSFQNSNAGSDSITKNNLNKYSTNTEKNNTQTGLTAEDITKYLTDLGYSVTSTPIESGTTWTCNTTLGSYNYYTTVFTDGYKIIVHEDVRL
jgi:hypothetical protein